jgi:hypothetical protein
LLKVPKADDSICDMYRLHAGNNAIKTARGVFNLGVR